MRKSFKSEVTISSVYYVEGDEQYNFLESSYTHVKASTLNFLRLKKFFESGNT